MDKNHNTNTLNLTISLLEIVYGSTILSNHDILGSLDSSRDLSREL
jgi:hypothetical protein